MNLLATAVALSDQDLLARLYSLARTERESTAELIAHLTALEIRPSLYLADGYGSLFDYCTRALGLSEDAACTRTKVVRICGRFPVILDGLFAGAVTLTAVRLLAPHLTAENHQSVLARATNKRLEDIQALVAELAPRPDVPASVRKVPEPRSAARPVWADAGTDLVTTPSPTAPAATAATPMTATLSDSPGSATVPSPAAISSEPPNISQPTATDHDDADDDPFVLHAPSAHHPRHRPIVQALAPHRYRVQFTIGQEAHDDLRTIQALLRREIPSGDAAAIFERALALLRKEVERSKLGKTAKPRKTGNARREGRAYEDRIRLKTDKPQAQGPSDDRRDGQTSPESQPPGQRSPSAPVGAGTVTRDVETTLMRRERAPSRHIPSAVKRVVWFRDRGQCAFVSANGRRCAERSFLELHHIQPYAMEGSATAGNIALRCRRHNQYEAELIFGRRGTTRPEAARPSEGRQRRS